MSDHTPHIPPILNSSGSLSPDYFEQLYSARADPWDFETSTYEATKYDATLAALPRRRYFRALELGCSIGVLTQRLAERCDSLLAIDVSSAALAQAQSRCARLPQVRFERCSLPDDFPEDSSFDLIMLSEVAYYFAKPDLQTLRQHIAAALAPKGHLLLVHFTGETNYPLTADAVHAFFLEWKGSAWRSTVARQEAKYRLDLFERI